jgi:hypothetical protein
MKRLAMLLLLVSASPLASCGMHSAFLEPEDAGPDFQRQGEYASQAVGQGVQVIALGDGAFRAVHLPGGLPGAGWDGRSRVETLGRGDGSGVAFEDGSRIEAGAFRIGSHGPSLPRVERSSPTLGAPPPAGAIVLSDASGERVEGELDARGLLAAGARSRDRFQSARIHVEFRTPFMPDADAQSRGNSGIYIQNRYEVQILDSFGLRGEWNECGGLYKVRKPSVNMAFPPLAWQTYDIDFVAARFDESGNKISPARISVLHNGVPIHENVAIPNTTGGGDPEGPEPGPVVLQDHWDPVFFRNVWVLPR